MLQPFYILSNALKYIYFFYCKCQVFKKVPLGLLYVQCQICNRMRQLSCFLLRAMMCITHNRLCQLFMLCKCILCWTIGYSLSLSTLKYAMKVMITWLDKFKFKVLLVKYRMLNSNAKSVKYVIHIWHNNKIFKRLLHNKCRKPTIILTLLFMYMW